MQGNYSQGESERMARKMEFLNMQKNRLEQSKRERDRAREERQNMKEKEEYLRVSKLHADVYGMTCSWSETRRREKGIGGAQKDGQNQCKKGGEHTLFRVQTRLPGS